MFVRLAIVGELCIASVGDQIAASCPLLQIEYCVCIPLCNVQCVYDGLLSIHTRHKPSSQSITAHVCISVASLQPAHDANTNSGLFVASDVASDDDCVDCVDACAACVDCVDVCDACIDACVDCVADELMRVPNTNCLLL